MSSVPGREGPGDEQRGMVSSTEASWTACLSNDTLLHVLIVAARGCPREQRLAAAFKVTVATMRSEVVPATVRSKIIVKTVWLKAAVATM